MGNDTDAFHETPRRWSIARVIGYFTLVVVLFIGTEILVAVVMLVVQSAATPDFDVTEWSHRLVSNGLFLSLATLATAVVCVPFVGFLVGRRESDPWHFLALRWVGARSIAIWVLVMAALVVVLDTVTVAIGRPLVPEFMVENYVSARHPAVLLVALALAAPLFEEIFFRGFLLSSLTSAGVPAIVSAILSSLAWAMVHLQYDLLDIATIFVMGLLLAAVRFRTHSIAPCLAMHSLVNVIAFCEVAFLAHSAVV